jgi:uncharacterized protein YabN with tetrapyrrole methylase and pyrophosphatase domain
VADPREALARLDEVTRLLRRECPWDREQDERSIVPHTVEEAYELADAAHAGDDAKLLDELGDVLFQVYFLSLLLEERGAGDLGQVAEQCRQKLIRRHPHVFGEEAARRAAVQGRPEEGRSSPDARRDASRNTPISAGEVLRNWDAIKAETEGGGLFGDLPETLPSTLYAKKAQRRARRAPEAAGPPAVAEAAAGLDAAEGDRAASFAAAGELLFAAVAASAAAGADPELALRAAADRYVNRVQEATTDQ